MLEFPEEVVNLRKSAGFCENLLLGLSLSPQFRPLKRALIFCVFLLLSCLLLHLSCRPSSSFFPSLLPLPSIPFLLHRSILSLAPSLRPISSLSSLPPPSFPPPPQAVKAQLRTTLFGNKSLSVFAILLRLFLTSESYFLFSEVFIKPLGTVKYRIKSQLLRLFVILELFQYHFPEVIF